MAVPPEFAWLVPVVVPFVIGLLVGAAIKRALKLITVVAALVIALAVTGVLNLTLHDLYEKAMKYLPRLYETGRAWLDALPYQSATFLIGLALGLWKG